MVGIAALGANEFTARSYKKRKPASKVSRPAVDASPTPTDVDMMYIGCIYDVHISVHIPRISGTFAARTHQLMYI